MACLAAPVLNAEMTMTLSADGVVEFQKMYDGTYVNNGLVLFMDTQSNDNTAYASTEHETEAYRPNFVITYSSTTFFQQVIMV